MEEIYFGIILLKQEMVHQVTGPCHFHASYFHKLKSVKLPGKFYVVTQNRSRGETVYDNLKSSALLIDHGLS